MKIRKIFLLSVIVLAFNIFIVNDISASEKETGRLEKGQTKGTKKTTKVIITNNTIIDNPDEMGIDKYDENVENLRREGEKDTGEENPDTSKTQSIQNILDKVLSWENRINFFGGIIVSCFNNYFKWWDYNPGVYRQFGCRGWRSGRFIKDIFQFEVNFINLGRGAFWTILGTYNLIKGLKKEDCAKSLYVSYLVAVLINKKHMSRIVLIGVFLIQGFISLPLTLHFSNFSISISLDSIIWGGIGMFLEQKIKKEEEERKKNIIELREKIEIKEEERKKI